MKNKKPSIKDFRRAEKESHKSQVNAIINETYDGNNQAIKVHYYKEQKRLKWWSWLTIVLIFSFGTGLSFLIGWLTYNSISLNGSSPGWKGVGWTSFSITILLLLGYAVLSWLRNKEAAKFFNHRGRRYQLTLTDWEAKIIVWKKILVLSALVMALVSGLTIGLM